MQKLLISGNTHTGRRRKDNQDAFIHRRLWTADKALLAVIDGVGGYTGGERAAAIAKDCIGQYMQIPRGDTLTMLREAVIFANNRIVEERTSDQLVSEMCCVLTAVVADSETKSFYYVHVGDTRLYRFREGNLQKITRDHSIVGIKEDAGEMTEQEAMNHPHRNQILREVGSALHRLDDEDFMDYGREDFLPGDMLLLCSDGLTDMVTSQQVTAILSTGQSLANKVKNLIALANEMGGHDNITVVLLKHQLTEIQAATTPVEPVAEEKPATVTPPVVASKKSVKERNRLLIGLLAIVAIAVLGWLITPKKNSPVTLPDSVIRVRTNDSMDLDSNRSLTSVRTVRAAVPGPHSEILNDTLRISSTQNLADLVKYADSTGRMIVLMPAKKMYQRLAAVEITKRSAKPGDTLLIKNLRLIGFDTGINVHIPVLLKTENLVFENIRYPFSYRFKENSRQTNALYTNSVQ
jgi:serine/threonine protein phosphatase PrpC